MSDVHKLAEIEARLSAATPGPWDVDAGDGTVYALTDGPVFLFVPHEDHCIPRTGQPSDDCLFDAEFIANAPADIAYLLAELRKRA